MRSYNTSSSAHVNLFDLTSNILTFLGWSCEISPIQTYIQQQNVYLDRSRFERAHIIFLLQLGSYVFGSLDKEQCIQNHRNICFVFSWIFQF